MLEVFYDMLQPEAPRLPHSTSANSSRVATDRVDTSSGTMQGLPGELTIKDPSR